MSWSWTCPRCCECRAWMSSRMGPEGTSWASCTPTSAQQGVPRQPASRQLLLNSMVPPPRLSAARRSGDCSKARPPAPGPRSKRYTRFSAAWQTRTRRGEDSPTQTTTTRKTTPTRFANTYAICGTTPLRVLNLMTRRATLSWRRFRRRHRRPPRPGDGGRLRSCHRRPPQLGGGVQGEPTAGTAMSLLSELGWHRHARHRSN